jgi:uncharacterized tellurite resistance protein B-like protein
VNAAAGLELTKLLLQVVYADDVVTAPERTALLAAAERLAGAAGVDLVTGVLDRGQPLPAPNMGMLAAHRADVMLEVGRLAAADGVQREEVEMIKTIAEMLR